MPQSRGSPSEHGSWSCRRHNWRSWIPQLTDSWSHSEQALRGSVTIIKVWPRRKNSQRVLETWKHMLGGFSFLHRGARTLDVVKNVLQIALIPHGSKPPRNELLENPLPPVPVQWLQATQQPCSKMRRIKLLDPDPSLSLSPPLHKGRGGAGTERGLPRSSAKKQLI